MFRRYHNDSKEDWGGWYSTYGEEVPNIFFFFNFHVLFWRSVNQYTSMNLLVYQFTLALVEKVRIHWLIYGTQSILKWFQLQM